MDCKQFDGVVMLTWSNWATEPRSNRYHYAKRFGRQVPVLFVQPDRAEEGYSLEATELENVQVLHVSGNYGSAAQHGALREAMRLAGITKPVVWGYNVYFTEFMKECPAVQVVYHATEDYFSEEYDQNEIRPRLIACLEQCDLVVACSPGVLENYLKQSGYGGRSIVLPNGCDFEYYGILEEELGVVLDLRSRNTVIYQGGINYRLDLSLLRDVVAALPDWDFKLYGPANCDVALLEPVLALPNVAHHGVAPLDQLREHMRAATVGVIPFKSHPYILRQYLPLKSFEYLASGLPVVSVPFDALLPHKERGLFHFASSAEAFADEIRDAASTAFDRDVIRLRLGEAHKMSYDKSFSRLMEVLTSSGKGDAAEIAQQRGLWQKVKAFFLKQR